MSADAAPNWESVLFAYLTGKTNLESLYQSAKDPLVAMVRRVAPFLPADLQEDAVQQLFIRLIENPPVYDPDSCSLRSLAFGLLRNAVRQIGAMFTQPGAKTRPKTANLPNSTDCSARCYPNEQVEEQFVDEQQTAIHLDAVESHIWTPANTLAYTEAHRLLGILPKTLATTLWMSHAEERSAVEIAGILGKSRFVVARDIRKAVAQLEHEYLFRCA